MAAEGNQGAGDAQGAFGQTPKGEFLRGVAGTSTEDGIDIVDEGGDVFMMPPVDFPPSGQDDGTDSPSMIDIGQGKGGQGGRRGATGETRDSGSFATAGGSGGIGGMDGKAGGDGEGVSQEAQDGHDENTNQVGNLSWCWTSQHVNCMGAQVQHVSTPNGPLLQYF